MRSILNNKMLHPRVVRILDNYFGESLENSEEEITRRKHLYEPLSALAFDMEINEDQHRY